uniref:Uncharacterized protein LOC100371409 n=1 Tax=Saccoglossus kowalevskii TaxID=10224 RepID=A0ABM0M7F6_SACKO|nr:PREDICTED: uncharacterized protein LOC100371409 [Saccoglossus kowalevskii]
MTFRGHKKPECMTFRDHKEPGCMTFRGHKEPGCMAFRGHKEPECMTFRGHKEPGCMAFRGHKELECMSFRGHKEPGCMTFRGHKVSGCMTFSGQKEPGCMTFRGHTEPECMTFRGHKEPGCMTFRGHKEPGCMAFRGYKEPECMTFRGHKEPGCMAFRGHKEPECMTFRGHKEPGCMAFRGHKELECMTFRGHKEPECMTFRGHKEPECMTFRDHKEPGSAVPDCLLCGTFKKFVQECNLWISSGGTSSVLHYDADHNIHCLFDGRKDIILIHPKYQDYLDMVKKASYSGSSYSTMDMDMINMYKNPNIAKVPWTWATIRPGDCVYLPAGYLHQVRSYGRSLAATILFTTDGDFDDSDCDDATFNYTSLADIDVTWTYKKGDKTIDMGYMNIEIIRRNLLAFSQEEDRLLKERFIYYYYDMQDKEEENIPPAEQAWAKLDKAGKGFLTRNEIINMDKEILKDFARFVDPPHGPSGGETHDEL